MQMRRLAVALKVIVAVPVLAAGIASGAAPPGRYTVSNGTVRDQRTGLLWQQSSGRFETQASGITYCAGLSLGGFSAGWRAPTIAELLSIVDPTQQYPAIDSAAFPNVDGYTWSATPYQPASGQGWAVDFSTGSADPVAIAATYTIRCVR